MCAYGYCDYSSLSNVVIIQFARVSNVFIHFEFDETQLSRNNLHGFTCNDQACAHTDILCTRVFIFFMLIYFI